MKNCTRMFRRYEPLETLRVHIYLQGQILHRPPPPFISLRLETGFFRVSFHQLPKHIIPSPTLSDTSELECPWNRGPGPSFLNTFPWKSGMVPWVSQVFYRNLCCTTFELSSTLHYPEGFGYFVPSMGWPVKSCYLSPPLTWHLVCPTTEPRLTR